MTLERSTRRTARRPGSRRSGALLWACAVLFAPVCLLVAPASAQAVGAATVSGQYQEGTTYYYIGSGTDIVLINPCDPPSGWPSTNFNATDCNLYSITSMSVDYPMPDLTFTVGSPYNTSAYNVDWQFTSSFTDRAALQANRDDPEAYGSPLPGDQPFQFNWPYEASPGKTIGGSVTVTAVVYSCSTEVATGSIGFHILGANQDQTLTDAEENSIEGPYWFFPYILYVESVKSGEGLQFFASTGHPLWGKPDGNGVMQIDRTEDPGYYGISTASANATNQDPYWMFTENMQDAVSILNNKASGNCSPGTCAYPFWDSQVKQMCSFTRGTYSGGSAAGDATCSVVQQPGVGVPSGNPPPGWLYQEQSLPNCSSHFVLSDGQPSDWKDAELIKSYNGAHAYYINWDLDSADPADQYWYFVPGSNNYVYNVCNASAY